MRKDAELNTDSNAPQNELTRRESLRLAGLGGAVMLLQHPSPKKKGKKIAKPIDPLIGRSTASAPKLIPDSEHPSLEEIALHRIAFGPRPGDVEHLHQVGLEAYLHEQLHPDDADDTILDKRLATATLPIEYRAGLTGKLPYPGVKEDRPLRTLNASVAELYKLLYNPGVAIAQPESNRPLEEVKAAKIIRATYSKWQLREVMCDFWHNHFSIDAYVDEPISRVMFPIYDRDVIRKHSLGNFREFLGAVARSQPMLVYLNNNTSKASPANENYARELFELHTLGADHYYNDLYQEWSKVPGADIGKPAGYIDQDVYEAARAFTGWTIGDGAYDRGERLPHTGEFVYHDGWHDPYQKRILAQNFDPYQAPMSDGDRVLDLVAYHPGTAKFICKKLCTRLISPVPPESLVNHAAAIWSAEAKNPLQIAMTIRAIVLSDEFKSTWGRAIKLPFESMIAFFRATGADVKPGGTLFGMLANMGEAQFNWPTPNGRPYDAHHWTGTMGVLSRWNVMRTLSNGRKGTVDLPRPLAMPVKANSFDEACTYWEHTMYGRVARPDTHRTFVEFLSQPFPKGFPDPGNKPYMARTQELIALIATSPDFHIR